MAKKKESKAEKSLTAEQLMKIENYAQRQKILQYELREIDYKMQLIRADMELAKLHVKLKERVITDYQRVIPDYKSKITEIKEEEKEYLKEVKKELDIQSERWGFDPDSGLIKEDEDKTGEKINV